MKVYVDDKEMREAGNSGESLAGTYRDVVRTLMREGKTVVSVLLDGFLLSQDELTKLLDGENVTGSRLDLRTMVTSELTEGTLREVLRHFVPLRSGLRLAVEHLGRNDRAAALEAFRPALEILLAVSEAVDKVCIITGLQLDGTGGDVGVGEAHGRIAAVLTEVQSAMEQQDWVKLGDLLEYEMLPAVDRWEVLVTSLLERLQADHKA